MHRAARDQHESSGDDEESAQSGHRRMIRQGRRVAPSTCPAMRRAQGSATARAPRRRLACVTHVVPPDGVTERATGGELQRHADEDRDEPRTPSRAARRRSPCPAPAPGSRRRRAGAASPRSSCCACYASLGEVHRTIVRCATGQAEYVEKAPRNVRELFVRRPSPASATAPRSGRRAGSRAARGGGT